MKAFDIGVERAVAVEQLASRCIHERAAIVTASNPGSKRLSSTENRARNEELILVLNQDGYAPVPCDGFDGRDAHAWREDSVLVPGIIQREAARLGAEFGENCVVWLEGGRGSLLLVARPGFAGYEIGTLIAPANLGDTRP